MTGTHRTTPGRRPVRRRRTAIAALLATLTAVSVTVTAYAAVVERHSSTAAAAPEGYGIFPDDLVPESAVDGDTSPTTLGLSFSTRAPGVVTAVEVYRGRGGAVPQNGTLWSPDGTRLASAGFSGTERSGWVTATLSRPVRLEPGRRYVASYDAPQGRYAGDNGELDADEPVVHRDLTAWRGVYTRTVGSVPTRSYRDTNYYVDVLFVPDADAPGTPGPTDPTGEPSTGPSQEPSGGPTTGPTGGPTLPPTDPTGTPTDPGGTPTGTPTDAPTASPTQGPGGTPTGSPSGSPTTPTPTLPPGGFPDAGSTGVPAGTALTPYTGPCTITQAGTVIDGRTVRCDLEIRASGVQIRNSVIEGTVGNDENTGGRSFTITDSEVRVGDGPGTGIGSRDFVATRVEVTGGNRSINCWMSCTVRDSWVHGQFTDRSGTYHESGIRMGAGSTIVGNTIVCDAPDVPPDAGCSAGLTGYGDFAAVRDVLVQGNLFPPSTGGTCAYGGSSGGKPFSAQAANIRFLDNVFVKGPTGRCGAYAPVLDFDRSAPGNQWSGNVWQDGGEVRP